MTPNQRIIFAEVCQFARAALVENFGENEVVGHLLFPGEEDSYMVEVCCGVYHASIVIPEDVTTKGNIEATVCLDDRTLMHKEYPVDKMKEAADGCWAALHEHYCELGEFLFGSKTSAN